MTASLRARAVGLLREVLEHHQRWAKVHAAEFLLALDYRDGVEEEFRKEARSHGAEPGYRIGVWRVLAQATYDPKRRARWVELIRDAALARGGGDRLEALEALARLGYQLDGHGGRPGAGVGEQAAIRRAAAEAGPVGVFARWLLVAGSGQTDESSLARGLASPDPQIRGLTAYALQHVPRISAATRRVLTAAASEPPGSPAAIQIVSALAMHAPEKGRGRWIERLRELAQGASPDERFHACRALAQVAGPGDVPRLVERLKDPDPGVRAAAAYAILRIGRRLPHALTGGDWTVIGLYALGMLAVGWYYARRTATTEDYLLGGRSMKPLQVGLSLFATLLSTISYLAYPGEMIRYGPMILAMVLAYPLVALVVGWLMIPFFMRLHVTSAYQILEMRLGLGVRLLGSFFFLALRLLWMAVIIYATTDTVLVPLLGLDASATPWLCAILGLITVAYTSMGGLRAVVLTDVVQTVILLGGALLTLILVTVYLGGIGSWWPTQWAAHWPEPKLYAPHQRITLVAIVLATFTWWVCTSGSDQMAIQRYLATRDVKAARNVLVTTLGANTLVNLLLTLVGLALLAYFRGHPHLVPDGQTILDDADRLFPQFIARVLPAGLSGLVVAGLLAAAMSSLSSGINSSCSVITVDFIDRFRRAREREVDHVRLAKYVSVAVGVVVVVLSGYVGVVQGNLLEVAYKVVNLITAPLFGLFFMAMFVPWARGGATILGAACGLATVITISFWRELTGSSGGISFLWAMPLGFLVQVGVGAWASLMGVGSRGSGRP